MKIERARLIEIIAEELREANDREQGIAPVPRSIKTPQQYQDWVRSGEVPDPATQTVPDKAKKAPSRAADAGTFKDLVQIIETSFGKLERRIRALEEAVGVGSSAPDERAYDTEYADLEK